MKLPRCAHPAGLALAFALVPAAPLGAQSVLYELQGVPEAEVGFAVSGVGDVDGDGVPDFVSSSPNTSHGGFSGSARVFSGATGEILDTYYGSLTFQDEFGWSVGWAGDVDNDGRADTIVGARQDLYLGGTQPGYVTIFSGIDGTVARTHQGALAGDEFGYAVSWAGDVDDDGFDDYLVGARTARAPSLARTGSVTLFSGKTGFVLGVVYGDSAGDNFGNDVACAGDANADGYLDLLIGSRLDDGGVGLSENGSVYVVSGESIVTPPFVPAFLYEVGGQEGGDHLGESVDGAGDVDADGHDDWIAGALGFGAPFLPVGYAEVRSGDGGSLIHFVETEIQDDRFGYSVAGGEDVNGDGWPDFAVGAILDDEGGTSAGKVYVYSGIDGGLLYASTGGPSPSDWLGYAVDLVPDVKGDGRAEVLAAASQVLADGYVRVLSSEAGPGVVLDQQKVSATQGGFSGGLSDDDRFGGAVAALGDLDGDGVDDLAVGASGTDAEQGSVWILFLDTDGTVLSEVEIAEGLGGFTGDLDAGDFFGSALAAVGDLDGDRVTDLAVGAPGDDDDGVQEGAVWILFLNADGSVKATQKITANDGGYALSTSSFFGVSLAGLGDLDKDGVEDLAVGHAADIPIAFFVGAIQVLFLKPDGTVKSHQTITQGAGGFGGTIGDSDFFAASLANLGDLDGDGVIDLAVGEMNDNDGAPPTINLRGAAWVLFLNTNGTVKGEQKISSLAGDFTGSLVEAAHFGQSVTGLGDLDGDGVKDLAVGSSDDDGGVGRGAVWVLFLRPDGTVETHVKISDVYGGFTGQLADGDGFGSALAQIRDLDGDGLKELVVGAGGDDDGATGFGDVGALWVLSQSGVPDFTFGSGLNPAGSMAVLSGDASVGSDLVFGLDNPLGTQTSGSNSLLGVSAFPDPSFPAGTPLPGFGMSGPGAAGELLISLFPTPILLVGTAWLGPGLPATATLSIPANPALAGLTIYTQGMIVDALATFGVGFGLTDAAEIVIQP